MDSAVNAFNRDSQVLNEVFTNFLVFLHLFSRAKAPKSIRLNNQTAIVTGGNRGIGKMVVHDLASRGARVIIACRNLQAGEDAANEVRAKYKDANVDVKKLDLASSKSIKDFARDIIENEPKLDILINNAGVITRNREFSEDGLEMMHAVNLFGPSLLTMELVDKMTNSSDDARVLNVASLAHHDAEYFDESILAWNRTYHYFHVYGHSKLGVILLTREMAKRLYPRGIRVYAVDPGMAQTNLTRDFEPMLRFLIENGFRPALRTPEASAESIVWAVVHNKTEYNPDKFHYGDGREKPISRAAQSESTSKLLWNITKNLLQFREF